MWMKSGLKVVGVERKESNDTNKIDKSKSDENLVGEQKEIALKSK